MYQNRHGVVHDIDPNNMIWKTFVNDKDLTPYEPPVKPEAPKVAKEEDIKDLRKAYEDKFGKKPFAGWDIDTLREKMAEAE